MRITARISSSGMKWNPRLPIIPNIDDFFTPNDKGNRLFDHRKALAVFGSPENAGFVTMSESDNPLVILIASILVNNVNKWLDRNEIEHGKSTGIAKRLERKISNNRESLTRISISRCGNDKTVRLKIETADNDIVERRRWGRVFAGIVAEHIANIIADAQKNLDANFLIDKSLAMYAQELQELRAQLRHEDEIAKLNAERIACKNYKTGFCTPVNPSCPCCCNGKCVEAKP